MDTTIKKPDKQSFLYLIIVVAVAVLACLDVYYTSRTEIEEVTFEKPGSGLRATTEDEISKAVFGLKYDDFLEIAKKHPETPIDVSVYSSFDTKELRQLTNLRVPGTNVYISVPEESLEQLLEEFGYKIRDYTKTKIPVSEKQTGYGEELPGEEEEEEEPPGEEPPGEEPPGEEPPGTEPPGTEPPGEEPPGTEPPGTEPPKEEPSKEEPFGEEEKTEVIIRAIQAGRDVFTPEMQEAIDEANIFVLNKDDFAAEYIKCVNGDLEAGYISQEEADFKIANLSNVGAAIDREGNMIVNKDGLIEEMVNNGLDPTGLFVHEYAHVVDRVIVDDVAEMEYSGSEEYQDIYNRSKAEDAGFVSDYAKSSSHEDFAETVRLYQQTGGDPTKITDDPKSQELIQERFDYLEENGIVEPSLEILLPFLPFNPLRVQPAKIGSSS